ncbi:hypothetical protein [Pectobacterium odoriferum]|uniref:hypothetical protein n=1 Tax=Pectobacterium odoriferum TaxID=78398 RepID=UPI00057E9B71|nr:hypothetical protein [Pectobacterium odoriferum]
MNTLTNERLEEIIERRSPSLRWEEAPAMATELLSLRAQLAELGRQAVTPFAWANLRDGDPTFPRIFMEEDSADWMVEKSTVNPPVTKIPLYSRPAPQAVIQPVKPIGFIEAKSQGTDTYTLKCFYRPEGTSNLVGQKVYAAPPASQPYTVPDEVTASTKPNSSYEWRKGWNACRAAMIQSGNSPVSPDSSATPIRYMNRFTGNCVTLEQQPDADTDTDVYIPLVPQHRGE